MMPTAIVLQQAAPEGPGTIADAAARAGYELDVRELYRGNPLPAQPNDADAIIVMGGPMNVDEVDAYPFLAAEHRFLQAALAADRPILGFCLGSQLLAKAAGARVEPAGIKEIGWYQVRRTPDGASDPLLESLDDNLTVFHWHGDTYNLPEGATLLYTSEPVRHQAFRLGRRAYGFQFHIEVTEAMIEEWIRISPEELASVADYIDPQAIRDAVPRLLPPMQAAGAVLLDRWFALVNRHSAERSSR